MTTSVLKKALCLLTRNPVTKYMSFVRNAASNIFSIPHFQQGYLARVGGSQIGPFVKVFEGAKVGNCRLGRYTYIAADSTVVNTEIGSFCSIGPGCHIGLSKHPSRNFVSTSPVFFSSSGKQTGTTFVQSTSFAELERTTLGHDVWIGARALIVAGVHIGNGAIIGAGAVVVSDIPAFAVYGGVPARLIRSRFNESQVEWLESFRWWDREEGWLRANANHFRDIDALTLFIEHERTSTQSR